MIKKTTILFHSRTGLSALIAGLSLSEGGPSLTKESLPRLWRQLNEPGQFLAFECENLRAICFNSGTVGKYVEQVVKTSTGIWNGQHITSHYIPEGVLSQARTTLFCIVPSLTWLIAPELKWGKDVGKWR